MTLCLVTTLIAAQSGALARHKTTRGIRAGSRHRLAGEPGVGLPPQEQALHSKDTEEFGALPGDTRSHFLTQRGAGGCDTDGASHSATVLQKPRVFARTSPLGSALWLLREITGGRFGGLGASSDNQHDVHGPVVGAERLLHLLQGFAGNGLRGLFQVGRQLERRWARTRTVSATSLAKSAGGGPLAWRSDGQRRQAGIAEHERFGRDGRRFPADGIAAWKGCLERRRECMAWNWARCRSGSASARKQTASCDCAGSACRRSYCRMLLESGVWGGVQECSWGLPARHLVRCYGGVG